MIACGVLFLAWAIASGEAATVTSDGSCQQRPEFGIVAPVGRKGVTELLHVVADQSDKRVTELARACLAALGTQLLSLKQQILEFDRLIMAWHRSNQTTKRFHYTLWSRVLLTPGPSDQDVTFRPPGLDSFRSSTRVGARIGRRVMHVHAIDDGRTQRPAALDDSPHINRD